MDNDLIISTILNILADDGDAGSIQNCALINRQWCENVYFSYPRFYKTGWMWTYNLLKPSSSTLQKEFLSSLLSLLLKDSTVAPGIIVDDAWRMMRFVNRKGNSLTMSIWLDRIIPDNTDEGNDMTLELTEEKLKPVLHAINQWLYKFAYGEKPSDETPDLFDMECHTDTFYEDLLEFCDMPEDKKDEWYNAYTYYDSDNEENEDNESKITLYLNKLKTIYALVDVY